MDKRPTEYVLLVTLCSLYCYAIFLLVYMILYIRLISILHLKVSSTNLSIFWSHSLTVYVVKSNCSVHKNEHKTDTFSGCNSICLYNYCSFESVFLLIWVKSLSIVFPRFVLVGSWSLGVIVDVDGCCCMLFVWSVFSIVSGVGVISSVSSTVWLEGYCSTDVGSTNISLLLGEWLWSTLFDWLMISSCQFWGNSTSSLCWNSWRCEKCCLE